VKNKFPHAVPKLEDYMKRHCQCFKLRALLCVEKCFQKVPGLLRSWKSAHQTLLWHKESSTTGTIWAKDSHGKRASHVIKFLDSCCAKIMD